MRAMKLPLVGRGEPSWWVGWGTRTGIVCALLLGVPAIAHGESDTNRAAARATAESGLAAYNGGRYAEALDLLRRAESILHAPTHLIYMARAANKLRHLVQARELYLKLTRETLAADAPPAFREAQQEAQRELAAIETRLPYLTIKADQPPPAGTKIKLDDHEIPEALIGVPFPVDPGEHVVVAVSASEAPGESARVTVVEGKHQEVTVRVPSQAVASPVNSASNTPAQEKPQEVPAPVSNQTAAAPPAPSVQSEAHGSGDKGRSPILGYGAIGLGVVGAVVGTVFLVQRGTRQSDADSAFNDCKARYCGPNDIEHFTQLDKDAATAGTVAWVSYGVGAAALTTGLYLLITGHPKQTVARTIPTLVPYVGPAQAGATLRF
jgi:hypothetical protein